MTARKRRPLSQEQKDEILETVKSVLAEVCKPIDWSYWRRMKYWTAFECMWLSFTNITPPPRLHQPSLRFESFPFRDPDATVIQMQFREALKHALMTIPHRWLLSDTEPGSDFIRPRDFCIWTIDQGHALRREMRGLFVREMKRQKKLRKGGQKGGNKTRETKETQIKKERILYAKEFKELKKKNRRRSDHDLYSSIGRKYGKSHRTVERRITGKK